MQMSAFQMPLCHADCLHVPLKEFFRRTRLGQKKVVREQNGEIDLPRISTAVCNLLLVSLGNLPSSPVCDEDKTQLALCKIALQFG